MNTTFTHVSPHSRQPDNFDKGYQFEAYVAGLFSKPYFQPKNWRKSQLFDKSSLPLDHWNPDLEMELVFTSSRKYSFAVECKWRMEFRDGKIKWAEKHQIVAYQNFQNQVRIPVFVAIGIGGFPDNAEKLFLTPLNSISTHSEVYESELIPYQRKTSSKFYYKSNS